MSRIKFATNPTHTAKWVERVGKLILNFSALELESIHWHYQLSDATSDLKVIAETPFVSRVNQIIMLIEERKIDNNWRKQSLRAWNDAIKISHIRNQVAHNPIVFAFSKTPEVGEPDILGIPNMRPKAGAKPKWILSTNEADQSINTLVNIAHNLAELRMEWCNTRDQGKAPNLKTKPSLYKTFKRDIGRVIFSIKRKTIF